MAAAKKAPPVLTPAPLPPLSIVPGVLAAADQRALRCPGCNRLMLAPVAYLDSNAGANCSCPLCGMAVVLPPR